MVAYDGRQRKNKRYLVLFMAVLLMFSVGCRQKKGGDADTGGQRKEEGQKLTQYDDIGGTVWTETWEAESSYYAKIAVRVDALVIVPAVEKMSVAEVKEFTFDKENIQMVAQGIFGSSVSSYDERNLPKDMLERRLEEAKISLEGAEREKRESERNPDAFSDQGKIAEDVEIERKEVKRLTELLESGSAGEDFAREPAGEYQSDHYTGEQNGVEYLLDFEEEEVVNGEGEGRKILFAPRREKDVWPKELKEMDTVEKSTSSRKPEEGEDLDKAQKAAEDFLKKAGFSDTLCSSSDLLLWEGTSFGRSEQETKKVVQRGYRFIYVTGVDGMTFRTPGAMNEYSWSKDSDNEYPGYTQIELDVTDAGVVSAEWTYPIITTSVTSNVQLLPFDDIKNAVRESMGKCVDALYYVPDDKKEREKAKQEVRDVKVSRMKLGYFRLKDPSREGYYSYVPVWQAEGICVVNAIDGTVIDLGTVQE